MPPSPQWRGGVALDGDGRPPRAPTSARPPIARAVLAGCAREGEKGIMAARVKDMMLNIFARAWRVQDIESLDE